MIRELYRTRKGVYTCVDQGSWRKSKNEFTAEKSRRKRLVGEILMSVDW